MSSDCDNSDIVKADRLLGGRYALVTCDVGGNFFMRQAMDRDAVVATVVGLLLFVVAVANGLESQTCHL
jgi:hypothetical protein